MALIPCQCCGQEYDQRWRWYVCDTCGYRICPSCLGRHTGKYGSGGFKCSQCAFGHMKDR